MYHNVYVAYNNAVNTTVVYMMTCSNPFHRLHCIIRPTMERSTAFIATESGQKHENFRRYNFYTAHVAQHSFIYIAVNANFTHDVQFYEA
jgi:hypothetical protein